MPNNKMIIAYDGSAGSKKALKHAADHFNGELEVVTVMDKKDLQREAPDFQGKNGQFYSSVNGSIYPLQSIMVEAPINKDENSEFQLIQRRREQELYEKRKDLLLKAKEVMGNQTRPVQAKVLYADDPAEAICDYALAQKAELIVLGHRGLSGIKKFVLGSVSEKVVQDAECSVYVAK